jgi:DNA ligase 1
MLAFARLFDALDRTTRTSGKVAVLTDYFRCTPPADAAWALWFLCGRRLKRAVKTAHLRQCAAEVAGLPLWLVEACCEHVGHLGETLALLLPPNSNPAPPPLAELVERRLLPLAGAAEAMQRELLRATWSELDTPQRFLWHRLITGHFRAGAWQALLVPALATLAGVEPPVMTHRLMGEWRPTPADLSRLLSGASAEDAAVRGVCLIQTDLFITEEATTRLPVPLRLCAPRPTTSRGVV